MIPKTFVRQITFFGVLFLLFLHSSYAIIALDPLFQGTILITTPTGEITLLETGQPIPEIPSGSEIEVFGGAFTISTEDGESVTLSCHSSRGVVGNGASATLTCGEDSGNVTAVKGSISVVDSRGAIFTVQEGAGHPIKKVPGPVEAAGAPPTGAGEPTGGSPLGGDLGEEPDFDSRDAQASLFQ